MSEPFKSYDPDYGFESPQSTRFIVLLLKNDEVVVRALCAAHDTIIGHAKNDGLRIAKVLGGGEAEVETEERDGMNAIYIRGRSMIYGQEPDREKTKDIFRSAYKEKYPNFTIQ